MRVFEIGAHFFQGEYHLSLPLCEEMYHAALTRRHATHQEIALRHWVNNLLRMGSEENLQQAQNLMNKMMEDKLVSHGGADDFELQVKLGQLQLQLGGPSARENIKESLEKATEIIKQIRITSFNAAISFPWFLDQHFFILSHTDSHEEKEKYIQIIETLLSRMWEKSANSLSILQAPVWHYQVRIIPAIFLNTFNRENYLPKSTLIQNVPLNAGQNQSKFPRGTIFLSSRQEHWLVWPNMHPVQQKHGNILKKQRLLRSESTVRDSNCWHREPPYLLLLLQNAHCCNNHESHVLCGTVFVVHICT